VRHKDRYAKYLNTLPLVVFVCRDEDSAREFCRSASRFGQVEPRALERHHGRLKP
jgi:hypothetical protein